MRTTLMIIIALLASMSATRETIAQQQSDKNQQSVKTLPTPSLVLSPCSIEGSRNASINGDATARHLPNSLHVIIPHGAHGFGGLEGIDCIERLNTEFVEKGTVKGLDTSCVKAIRRKGFSVAL